VLIERLQLIEDSAGPGEFRGGCGLRKDLRVLADDVTLYNLGDRHVFAPYGLAGGKSGRVGVTLLNHDRSNASQLHSKGTYRLKANDLISWQTAGAGGVGNPMRRAPKAVLRDVRNGLVSIEGAMRDYGVVIDPKRLTIDAAATERRRRRPSGASATVAPGERRNRGTNGAIGKSAQAKTALASARSTRKRNAARKSASQ
jgi:N-methylhydantoinase B